MNIVSLFPTALGIFNLDRELTEEEKKVLLNQPVGPNMGNKTSVERFILRDPALANLKEFIQTSVDKYFNEVVAASKDASLYITQSWVNYSAKNEWHHAHAHPNSILSGVFYVQSTNEDKIYFEKNTYSQIEFPTENYNTYNSTTWWIEAFQGRLVIFPSSLRHYVNAVETDTTRVSLSFNTFARGTIGSNDTLTLLEVGQIYQ